MTANMQGNVDGLQTILGQLMNHAEAQAMCSRKRNSNSGLSVGSNMRVEVVLLPPDGAMVLDPEFQTRIRAQLASLVGPVAAYNHDVLGAQPYVRADKFTTALSLVLPLAHRKVSVIVWPPAPTVTLRITDAIHMSDMREILGATEYVRGLLDLIFATDGHFMAHQMEVRMICTSFDLGYSIDPQKLQACMNATMLPHVPQLAVCRNWQRVLRVDYTTAGLMNAQIMIFVDKGCVSVCASGDADNADLNPLELCEVYTFLDEFLTRHAEEVRLPQRLPQQPPQELAQELPQQPPQEPPQELAQGLPQQPPQELAKEPPQ